MSLRSRCIGVAVVAVLALGPLCPEDASAVSLADLTQGGSMSSANGSLSFGNFSATARGRRVNRDLSLYEVIPTDDGITLMSSANGRARLRLSYDVTAVSHLIEGANLSVNLGTRGARGRGLLRDAGTRLDRLNVSQRPGRNSDDAVFAALNSVGVSQNLSFVSGGASDAFTSSFAVSTPEPTTALLLASGLAALAIGRRSRKTSL